MADELDPRLEASLRAALHHEADQLSLTITGGDIERARRRRGRGRLAPPASLLAAAAVIAVLVVVVGAWRANQSLVATSPSPTAAATAIPPLAGFGELEALLAAQGVDAPIPVAVRGEHPAAEAGEAPVRTSLGTVENPTIAGACLGDPIDVGVRDANGGGMSTVATCDGESFLLMLGETGDVWVQARPSVRWRLVAGTVPGPSVDPASRLKSMADLEAALIQMSPAMPVIASGEHLDPAGATGPVTTELGPVGAYRFLNVMVDCLGGDIRIAVMDGETEGSSFSPKCNTTSIAYTDGVGSPATGNRIVVTARAEVRWRVVVSVSSLECTPLGSDATDRGLTVVGEVPTPNDKVGTMSWRTVDGATITGDTGSLPALGGPLTVNLPDGVGLDPGQHCFEPDGVEAGILPLGDYDAARASGIAPSFTSLAVEPVPDSRVVSIPLLRPGAGPTGAQVIRFRAAWHRSDGKRDVETWMVPIVVATTGIGPVLSYQDLAVHAEGTVELLRNEHAATATGDRTVAGLVGAVSSVEIVLACDTGTVTLGFRSGGTTDVASPKSQDCGQGATSLVLPSPSAGDSAMELVVDAPAGTTWRLIGYDHDRDLKPSIETALPLPTPKEGQTVEGVIMSVITGGAPPASQIEVYAGPQGTTYQVVYACEGAGTVHVTLGGSTQDMECMPMGRLRFTPPGFGPSTLTVTSDRTVRLHLELWSIGP